MLVYAVNRVVAWEENTDDCAGCETYGCADRCTDSLATYESIVLPRPGADSGPRSCAHNPADKGIAQMVLVFHESYAVNVLPRNSLSTCVVLVQDRGLRKTHEGSRMFVRVHFDDLNLLPRM